MSSHQRCKNDKKYKHIHFLSLELIFMASPINTIFRKTSPVGSTKEAAQIWLTNFKEYNMKRNHM
ncbi:MAG: hypothetical protein ABI371_04970, partial [Gelidibacter sp.]